MRRLTAVSIFFAALNICIEASASVLKYSNRNFPEGSNRSVLSQNMQPQFGDPSFDFSFAEQAMAKKNHDEAVFAFERVLMQQPNNTAARLLFAHALIDNDDPVSALAQLLLLTGSNKNDSIVMDQIRKLKNYAVDKIFLMRANKISSQTSLSFEFKEGYDTNAKSITEAIEIEQPDNGVVQMSNLSKFLSDYYTKASVRLNMVRPLNKKWGVYFGFNMDSKDYYKGSALDTNLLFLRTGLQYKYNRWSVRIPVRYQEIQIDGADYLKIIGTGFDVAYIFSPAHTFRVSNKYNNMLHKTNSKSNQHQCATSLEWKISPLQSLWTANISFTTNKGHIKRINQIQRAKDQNTMSINLDYNLNDKHQLSANASYTHVKHQGLDDTYRVNRKDRKRSGGLGWDYILDPYVTLQTNYTFTKNTSNTPINRHIRHVATIGLKVNLDLMKK